MPFWPGLFVIPPTNTTIRSVTKDEGENGYQMVSRVRLQPHSPED